MSKPKTPLTALPLDGGLILDERDPETDWRGWRRSWLGEDRWPMSARDGDGDQENIVWHAALVVLATALFPANAGGFTTEWVRWRDHPYRILVPVNGPLRKRIRDEEKGMDIADVGKVVLPPDTPLATIEDLHPIFVAATLAKALAVLNGKHWKFMEQLKETIRQGEISYIQPDIFTMVS